MKHFTGLGWLLSRLTYLQVYLLFTLLFLLSLLPLTYFWIHNHERRSEIIQNRILDLKHNNSLSELMEKIQKVRIENYHELTQTQSTNTHLLDVQNQVEELFQQALLEEKELIFNGVSIFSLQQVSLKNVYEQWKDFLKQTHSADWKKKKEFHHNLLSNLQGYFTYFSYETDFQNQDNKGAYFLIQNVLLRLIFTQENLSELTLEIEELLKNHSLQDSQQAQLIAALNITAERIFRLKQQVELSDQSSFYHSKKNFFDHLYTYIKQSEALIQAINQQALQPSAPSLSIDQFRLEGDEVVKNGFALWNEGTQFLIEILQEEYRATQYELWSVLASSAALGLLAFLSGLSLTYITTNRLTELTYATKQFTNGDLSIRVPVTYQDELGNLGLAFNQMAQTLEEMLNRFYEVLKATRALTKGDIDSRIPIKGDDSEFNQLAKSFNQMAQTFENMISRLKELGVNLTTSASEISNASKEQETIIIEQESTTRQIAVAANEISSTAKEFANTMNEVSIVAEQTSNLAVTGKESLTNMETIMRQMVGASGNIASKLAVLNEKASNITSVITTITKVADQTNLLSLNASIEAEKAGEFGRSFAVIAREIRRLADQTAIATLDIEKIVNEIMAAISSSVMGVDDFTQEIREGVKQVSKVSEQLALIIEQVQTFTTRFEFVNQGMQAQSTGAEQINEAIAQLSHTAQQTTESIHYFHKTIQELNSTANELRTYSPFVKN